MHGKSKLWTHNYKSTLETLNNKIAFQATIFSRKIQHVDIHKAKIERSLFTRLCRLLRSRSTQSEPTTYMLI